MIKGFNGTHTHTDMILHIYIYVCVFNLISDMWVCPKIWGSFACLKARVMPCRAQKNNLKETVQPVQPLALHQNASNTEVWRQF